MAVSQVPVVPAPSIPVFGSQEMFPVRRVYCVGRNYLDHIREMKEGDERDPPFFFQKPSDAVVPSGSVIDYPPETSDFHFEIELVVAIGTAAANVSPEAALDCVFGYAVGLDMTRRDLQRQLGRKGLPWEAGKAFDQSAPCGPIVPVAHSGHRLAGQISLDVDGVRRQNGDLGQMIWNVPEIISNLSRAYRLMPGDLILTGTPAGVGPAHPGETLTGTVEGLPPVTVTIGERAQG